MNFESEKIEFKKEFSESIYKEVIAFANTDGGIIYVGIDNQGNVTGLVNVDDEYTRITNGIRDAINPDVTIFVNYIIQENKVVKISVKEGDNKPYYLKSKGIKPGGVFVRQGASTVPASFENIKDIIRRNDGDFESKITLIQDLSFNSMEEYFQRENIEFSEEKFFNLGMVDKVTQSFTNLAYWLSDQCENSVKIAVFEDDDRTQINDMVEFSGSLFQQFSKTFDYLSFINHKNMTFDGPVRKTNYDYPKTVIREVLLNAIVHKDYSYNSSIIINCMPGRIECISLGGLMPGLSVDDIKNGISILRNRNLASVFQRAGLIENYGFGIREIYNQYKDNKNQPEIIVTENTFKIILPNRNIKSNKSVMRDELVMPISPFVASQMKLVLEYIEKHGAITDQEISELLNIKRTRTYVLVSEMRKHGFIKVIGRGEERKIVKS